MNENINKGENPDYTLNSGRVDKIPMVATVKESNKELFEWVKASEKKPANPKNGKEKNYCCKINGCYWDLIFYDNHFNSRNGFTYGDNQIEWLKPLQSKPIEEGYNKKYVDGLTRDYGTGAPNKYQYTGPKCVAGCKNFTGYETHHHKDCPFYHNSMSKRYDEMEAKLKPIDSEEHRKDG